MSQCRVVDDLKRHPDLFEDTVFFVTFDEGGGYWDSGFFQPIDFFGDGPRIPMIAISQYSRGGRIVHTYADHASVLKFIEPNGLLKPLTARSRDNCPIRCSRSRIPTCRRTWQRSAICSICSISRTATAITFGSRGSGRASHDACPFVSNHERPLWVCEQGRFSWSLGQFFHGGD